MKKYILGIDHFSAALAETIAILIAIAVFLMTPLAKAISETPISSGALKSYSENGYTVENAIQSLSVFFNHTPSVMAKPSDKQPVKALWYRFLHTPLSYPMAQVMDVYWLWAMLAGMIAAVIGSEPWLFYFKHIIFHSKEHYIKEGIIIEETWGVYNFWGTKIDEYTVTRHPGEAKATLMPWLAPWPWLILGSLTGLILPILIVIHLLCGLIQIPFLLKHSKEIKANKEQKIPIHVQEPKRIISQIVIFLLPILTVIGYRLIFPSDFKALMDGLYSFSFIQQYSSVFYNSVGIVFGAFLKNSTGSNTSVFFQILPLLSIIWLFFTIILAPSFLLQYLRVRGKIERNENKGFLILVLRVLLSIPISTFLPISVLVDLILLTSNKQKKSMK